MTAKGAVLQKRAPNLAAGAALPEQSHLFRRGGIYYFRMTVPEPLREAIGKREFILSLRTGDFGLARRRASIESVKALTQIDDARRKLAVDASKTAPVTLSKGECWEIAARWFLEIEKEDILPSREQLEKSRRVLSILRNNEEPSEMRQVTDLWLTANGYDKIDDASHKMVRAFMLRARKAHELQLQNNYGTGHFLIEPPFADFRLRDRQDGIKPTGETKLTFAECLRRYREHQRPDRAPSTLLKERAQDDLMLRIFGANTPVSSIARGKTREFEAIVDKVPANFNKIGIESSLVLNMPSVPGSPMKPETKNQYIRVMRAVFRFAYEEYDLGKPPIGAPRTHRDDVRDRDKRLPFTQEHLQLIFDPANYPPWSQHAHFWLPLLALFTGARRGELVQLAVADIQTVKGIDGIAINDDGDGKRLKTSNSTRFVPLHDQLKFDFLAFVSTVKRRGACARLFEELYTAANAGDAFGKSFARRLRNLGINDKRHTWHSFRHNASQALANAEVSGELIDALQGWSSNRGMRGTYGGKYPPQLLSDAVNKIEYPGLNLAALTGPDRHVSQFWKTSEKSKEIPATRQKV